MPSCVFRKCTNYGAKVNKAQGITYHLFPSNEVSKEEWIAIVRKQRNELDWMPSNSSRICSIHFKSGDMYTSNKGRTLIKKNALPVIEKHGTQDIPNSPSSLDNVSISDMEEILESPRKAALKKCVKKLTFEKKKLQKKNTALIQQNKRLKKKVARMADILKILKKRNYISKEQFLQLKLKTEVIDLINRIYLKKNSKKSYRAKYPPALRKFALTFNFYSPGLRLPINM